MPTRCQLLAGQNTTIGAGGPVIAGSELIDGSVIVTSDVDEGPIKVTLFVPLSLSSNNSMKPAPVAPFLTTIPALAIN